MCVLFEMYCACACVCVCVCARACRLGASLVCLIYMQSSSETLVRARVNVALYTATGGALCVIAAVMCFSLERFYWGLRFCMLFS